MAGSVNKATILGNVGKEVDVRSTQSGQRIASFSVATSESWKDQSGERQERTTWHNIVIFNEHLVEIAEKYVKKGSKVYLEGAIQTRKWTDRDGNERYSTEIVLARFRGELQVLDGKPAGERQEEPARGGGQRKSPPLQELEDDSTIPF
jgi:single-strand DNA-binding protein